MITINFVLGDWSNDGHGRTETFEILWTNIIFRIKPVVERIAVSKGIDCFKNFADPRIAVMSVSGISSAQVSWDEYFRGEIYSSNSLVFPLSYFDLSAEELEIELRLNKDKIKSYHSCQR